jgi:hypothetical protein
MDRKFGALQRDFIGGQLRLQDFEGHFPSQGKLLRQKKALLSRFASEYPGATDKVVYGYPNVYYAAADDIETPLGISGMNLYYGPPSSTSPGTPIPNTPFAVPDSQDSYGTNVKILTVTYPFSTVSKFPMPVPNSVTMQRTLYMRTAPVIPK